MMAIESCFIVAAVVADLVGLKRMVATALAGFLIAAPMDGTVLVGLRRS